MPTDERYLQLLEKKIDVCNAQIKALQSQALQADLELKIDCRHCIDRLRTKQQRLEQKLDDLRTAGSDAWDELRLGADIAVRDLGDALQSAINHFNAAQHARR